MKFISKTDFAYNEIKNKIGSGVYKNNNLYTIVDIANEIGVSRTPVSGAIKILESEGYITLYPGVGFRIKDISLKSVKESLLISGALEIVAMDYIIDNNVLNEMDIELLKEYVEDSRLAVMAKDGERYVQDADKYHQTLYKLINLPKVKEILNDHTFIYRSLYIEGVNKYSEMAELLVNDHNNILEAIFKSDKKTLREVVEIHEDNCYNLLKKVIEE